MSEVDNRSMLSYGGLNTSKISQFDQYTYKPSEGKLLPSIFKVDKYYANKQSEQVKNKMSRIQHKEKIFFGKSITSETKINLQDETEI